MDRLSARERLQVSSVYNEGSYASASVHGWLPPIGEKWLGCCRPVRSCE